MSLKKRIILATPIICLIIYLLLGYCMGLWHPGWVVFMLIPLMPVLLGLKKIKHFYPVFCLIIYLIIGIFLNWWHPGWVIFLTIPVVRIFQIKPKEKVEIVIEDEHDYR